MARGAGVRGDEGMSVLRTLTAEGRTNMVIRVKNRVRKTVMSSEKRKLTAGEAYDRDMRFRNLCDRVGLERAMFIMKVDMKFDSDGAMMLVDA